MSKEYHVLSLSGGKDSTALAFYIRDNMPEVHEQIEYVFCDTEVELPETYEYLDKIEVFLDKPVKRLKPYKSFEHLLEMYGYLPSPHRRWCTIELKTKPFKKYISQKLDNNTKHINMYIGIRADEAHRATEDKSGKNIKAIFPFVEGGLTEKNIIDILEENGIGLPSYYNWIDRSGCFFCFFKSKMKWINLYENHPESFEKAVAYESDEKYIKRDRKFGWNIDMSLKDMIKPENIKKIKEDFKKLQATRAKKNCKKINSNNLFDINAD